jgi:hypothetical protein
MQFWGQKSRINKKLKIKIVYFFNICCFMSLTRAFKPIFFIWRTGFLSLKTGEKLRHILYGFICSGVRNYPSFGPVYTAASLKISESTL